MPRPTPIDPNQQHKRTAGGQGSPPPSRLTDEAAWMRFARTEARF